MPRILIIDDDDQIRKMLRQMLEQEGFEVSTAHEGGAGVKSHLRNPADMVITDIIMPDQEGLETIQKFKNEFPDVKVIAMSGGGRIGPESYLHLARKFGAMHTFIKPIDRDDFLNVVRQLLGLDFTERMEEKDEGVKGEG